MGLTKHGVHSKKHGLRRTRLYSIYTNMVSRCYNGNRQDKEHYFDKGIKVCNEWMDSKNGVVNFAEWALSNGYKDNLTIERIDVNGNYEPSNCRWATWKEQQNNKNNNVFIEINGVTKTMSQWAEASGIRVGTIARRISLGWKGEELIKPLKDSAKKQSGIKGITLE